MALTEAEAKAVLRLVRGLNPRHDSHGLTRPTLQQTHDALTLLVERAVKAGQGGTLLESERVALRTLVDDLYHTEPADGPATRCVSWHWEDRPLVTDIAKAVNAVAAGTVHAREVQTGTDDYAIVISRHELNDDAALAAWEASR